MPRPSLGYRELSRVFPPWSEQSTASRQRPAHQGHRGASWSPELLAAGTVPTLGRLWDTAVDTISQSARAPRHAGMSPQGQGPEEPPPTLLLSPPLFPSHLLPPTPEGEAAASLRVSTAAPVCLPTRDCQPSALAQAPPILPGAAAARGACRPSRLHSGTRRWLDTDVNPAGRANSGHPQRQLRAQAGPAGKSYLGVAKYQGHC